MPPIEDLSLDEDVAELKREAQKAVDREIAARVELKAAIDNRISVRAKLAGGSAEAVAYIDSYVNPAAEAPTPIAPEVAAPAPVVEPPVFTTVDDTNVTPENSSGGVATVADALTVVDATATGDSTAAAGGAATTATE